MTTDYTKLPEEPETPKPAADLSDIPEADKPVETGMPPEKIATRICKQCYEIGKPRVIEHGTSWPEFFFALFCITPFLLTVRLLRFCLPFLPIAKFFIKEDESEWTTFPEMPYTLYGCRACNHPNSMVPIESNEGQDALYWNKKKNESEKLLK